MKAPNRPLKIGMNHAPSTAMAMLLFIAPWAAAQGESGAAPRTPDCAVISDEVQFIADPAGPQAGSSQDAVHKAALAFLSDPVNASIMKDLVGSTLVGEPLITHCKDLLRSPTPSEASSSSDSNAPGAVTEKVEASPTLQEAEKGGWTSNVSAGPAFVVAGGPAHGGAGVSVGATFADEGKGTNKEITVNAVKAGQGSTLTGDFNVSRVFLDKGMGVTGAIDAGAQHDAFNGFDASSWLRAGIGPKEISYKNVTLDPILYLVGSELDVDVHHAKTFMPFSPAIDMAAELTTKTFTYDWETEVDFYRHTLWGTSDFKATTNNKNGPVKFQANALTTYFGEPVAGAPVKPEIVSHDDPGYDHWGETFSAGAAVDPTGLAEKFGHLWGAWKEDRSAADSAKSTAL